MQQVTLSLTITFESEPNPLVRKQIARNHQSLIWSALVPAITKQKNGAEIPVITSMKVAAPQWTRGAE